MSNRWGTQAEHAADVRRQIALERGETPPAETSQTKTEENEPLKVEVPTVVLPDGTQVAVDQYDPYSEQRRELEAQRNQNEGILAFLKNQNVGQPGEEQKTEEEPEAPTFKPLEFSDDEMVDETTQTITGHLNEFAGYTNEQIAAIAKGQQKLTDDLGKLVKNLNNRYLEDDLAKVSAQTGFSREELIAANEATGIDDPNDVATFLTGKKAQEDAAKAKAEEADAERKRQAAGITGTTGGGTTSTDTPGAGDRENLDLRGTDGRLDAAKVAQHFKFGLVA